MLFYLNFHWILNKNYTSSIIGSNNSIMQFSFLHTKFVYLPQISLGKWYSKHTCHFTAMAKVFICNKWVAKYSKVNSTYLWKNTIFTTRGFRSYKMSVFITKMNPIRLLLLIQAPYSINKKSRRWMLQKN